MIGDNEEQEQWWNGIHEGITSPTRVDREIANLEGQLNLNQAVLGFVMTDAFQRYKAVLRERWNTVVQDICKGKGLSERETAFLRGRICELEALLTDNVQLQDNNVLLEEQILKLKAERAERFPKPQTEGTS